MMSVERSQEYLTFILDGEEYGVDILRVQEIRGWSRVTTIANMPEYLLGVINLRGVIVPIIDLRLRFNREKLEYGPTTVVIILRADTDSGPVTLGLVVDAVSEVREAAVEDIRRPPDFGGEIESEFIHGMINVDERIVILLDADSLLDAKLLYRVSSQLSNAS